MLPIVRSVWMNVHLSEVVVHHPKPPSMWKEGDRLRWRIENSLAHESTLHVCSHLWHCTANQLHAYVAVLCQSARLAGYHPPLARSPLFQRKRALYVRYSSFSFHTLVLLCTYGAPADLLVVARHTIDTTLEHGSGAHYFERR